MADETPDPEGAAGTIVGTCIASILDTWGDTMSECTVRIVSECVEFQVKLLDGRESGPVQVRRAGFESMAPNASVPASRLLEDPDWTRANPGALLLMREKFGTVWFENLTAQDPIPITSGTLGSFYEEAVILGLDQPPAVVHFGDEPPHDSR
jgi:hypothetical protein